MFILDLISIMLLNPIYIVVVIDYIKNLYYIKK